MTRALLVAALTATAARADAVASTAGGKTDVAGEIAVVIWDAAGGVEHLVRSLPLLGDAPHAGVLTATPTPPEVAAAAPNFFLPAEAATAPPVVTRTRLRFGPKVDVVPAPAPQWTAPFGAVRGADQRPVGEYRPSAPGAVRGWLGENGYVVRPAVDAWLKGYEAGGWAVTGLRVPWGFDDPPPRPGEVRPGGYGAVRFTFRAAGGPVLPSAEPADQPLGLVPRGRMLRVYVFADGRQASALATVWAGPVGRDTFEATAAACGLPADLAAGLAGRPWHLTEFEQWGAATAVADDVTFWPSPTRSALARPPTVVYQEVVWPYYSLAVLAAFGGLLVLLLVWTLVRRAVRHLPAAPLD